MKPTKVLQEIWKMRFDEAYEGWNAGRLHALTIGCFATLLIGMGTRVTLGHSGLPLQADTPIKLMFAGMQFAVLLRVLADMLPMQASHWLHFAAATAWLACFTP